MKIKLTGVEVRITKATITCIKFNYSEKDLPVVDVYVDLITDNGEVLTSILLSTNHYKKQLELDLPTSVYKLGGEVLKELTDEVRDKINGIQKAITEDISAR